MDQIITQNMFTMQKRFYINTLNYIKSIIISKIKNGLQWNRNTPMSKQWLKKIQQDLTEDKIIQYQFKYFLDLFNDNPHNYKQEIQIIYKDVIKGRTDSSVYNFSMRQFFYSVKADVEDQQSRQNIKNLLYAIAARFYKIGYCQGMSGIAAFILCFSDVKSAFIIFSDLLQNILPPDLFLQDQYGHSLSGLMSQTFFLQQQFIHILTNIKRPLIQILRQSFYDDDELNHFRTIIELLSSKVFLSLFIGIVSFSICIFIWKQVKQNRSFQALQRAFLAMIYMNRQKILQNRSFKLIQQILQNMTLQQFQQYYYDIEIDQQFKKQSLGKYYQNLDKKWNFNSDHSVKNLNKITKFTQKQVLKLKQRFPQTQGISISNQNFIFFVLQFYTISDQYCSSKISFLYNHQNLLKMICKFKRKKQKGFDLREFIIYLSLCIKNKLINRLIALISIYSNENNLINKENFMCFLKNIQKYIISNQKIKNMKLKFLERVDQFFRINNELNQKQLQLVFNDNYIHKIYGENQQNTEDFLFRTIEKIKQKQNNDSNKFL